MIKVVLFDTFGTIVDWRSSIAREGKTFAKAKDVEGFDGDAFARAWRAGYRPGMARVTAGERPFVSIDTIYRERLDEILPQFGLAMLDETERDHLNRAWHRLTPWPDSIPGLKRIKSKHMISPLSNGSVMLLATMAKRAGIPWDFIFSSDMHRAFKRNPAVYQNAIRLLGVEPHEIMMTAAHNDDLEAARKEGMRTAYINRPYEYGADQKVDFEATSDWDIIADTVEGVADQLDCPKL
jgi:2-haloacid dehalogenase